MVMPCAVLSTGTFQGGGRFSGIYKKCLLSYHFVLSHCLMCSLSNPFLTSSYAHFWSKFTPACYRVKCPLFTCMRIQNCLLLYVIFKTQAGVLYQHFYKLNVHANKAQTASVWNQEMIVKLYVNQQNSMLQYTDID